MFGDDDDDDDDAADCCWAGYVYASFYSLSPPAGGAAAAAGRRLALVASCRRMSCGFILMPLSSGVMRLRLCLCQSLSLSQISLFNIVNWRARGIFTTNNTVAAAAAAAATAAAADVLNYVG
ncbi:GH14897 [Drosophila grimshawi]|uniref:GH14897 n=1 Tax=Drosophila grimshawi TaxID=7222 RepID=B4J276_DROGR|nr:GH14897 [Drosophila grimshawi]